MRLAVVSLMGGHAWGGSEALWHALAKHALAAGDSVLVSVYNWGTLHQKLVELKERGAAVHTRRRYNANAGITERIGRFVRSRRPSLDKDYQTIIDFKPDAVLISQGDTFDLAIHHHPLYTLLQRSKISYCLVCHNHEQYGWLPPLEIFPGAIPIFLNAKKVYFVSQRQRILTERRLATRLWNGEFTWNPLNMDMPEEPLPWPQNKTAQFAIVGNLSGTKGMDTAFEVLSRSEWKERDWQLNVYGSGEGLSYLKALAIFYGISDRVSFKGFVNNIKGIWAHNNVLLIPSAGEGLPISLVEAMACGRPAIVTDVGGNTELITEKETGFVSVSPTAGAFAGAMEKAWREKSKWEEMGAAAFRSVQEQVDVHPERKIYTALKYANDSVG